MSCILLYAHLLLLFVFNTVASQSIISTLPGYPGTLPFKLETGYIGVGENEEVQLFYYFIESERNPLKDPLVLWLTGGPGCSAFLALVYEIGPLAFDISSLNGSLPSFLLKQDSWTKVANFIFLDQPAGTGFSYSTTSEGYSSSDTKTTKDIYMFMRKWLMNHPTFIKNSFYVAGDSYAGKITPMVAWKIHEGNEGGLAPQIRLQGYALGNPGMDSENDYNERVPFAHKMALISDEYFQLARNSCRGDYVNRDTSNLQCLRALQIIGECAEYINCAHILEPACKSSVSLNIIEKCTLVPEDDSEHLLLPSERKELTCRDNSYVASNVWANDPSGREALHTRQGTKAEWTRCNTSLNYERDVVSVFQYHQLLNQKGYHVLVYSGDHDLLVPYMSTLKWIRNLNLTIEEDWRPWNVDGQVAGYTMKYKNGGLDLVFATVKGGGHTAPEYKPKQCLAMVERWLSQYPL